VTAAFARVQCTQVKQPSDAGFLTSFNNSLNQFNVNPVKTLSATPAFIQDTGHADHGIGPGKLFNQHVGVVNISLHQLDTGEHIHATTPDRVPGQYQALMLIGSKRAQ